MLFSFLLPFRVGVNSNRNNLLPLVAFQIGAMVKWSEQLDYGAESHRKVVTSRLGFTVQRLENSLLIQQ